MKKFKLFVLLFFLSPFVFAQSPLTSIQEVNQKEKILFGSYEFIDSELFTLNFPEVASSEKQYQTINSNLENYLRLKGIKSKTHKDEPGTVAALSGEDILAAGTHHIDLSSAIAFGTFKNKYEGEDNGNTGTRNIEIRGGTNIINGFGVRTLVMFDGATYKPESGDDKDKIRNNFVRLELVKGFNIGGQAINVHAGYGIGVDKNITESGGMEFENKDDISNIQIGFASPIGIGGGATYFNPMICLGSTTWDYDGGKSTYNAIEIESNMYSFFNCAMFDPCNKDGLNLSQDNYTKGSSCIGSSTGFNFEIGTEKNELDGNPNDQESNNTHYGLSVDYSYFVTDDIAIRGLFDLAGETIKDKDDSDFKINQSDLWVGGGFVFHPPLEGYLNNTYAHAELQVGKDKFKQEGFSDFEDNENVTMIGFGVGYNLFVLPGIAFSPELNCTWFKQKNDDSDIETNFNGLSLDFGLKSFF